MTTPNLPLDTATVSHLLQTWPHPLPVVLRQYWLSRQPDANGSPNAPPDVYRLIDLSGTLIRFVPLLLLAESLHAQAQQRQPDSSLNQEAWKTLQNPVDGNWIGLGEKLVATRTAGRVLGPLLADPAPVITAQKLDDVLPPILSARSSGRNNEVRLSAWDLLRLLNRVRDVYFHGDPLEASDRMRAAELLEALLRRWEPLGRVKLAVLNRAKRGLVCQGIVADHFPEDPNLKLAAEPCRPCLVNEDGWQIPLWPLFLFADATEIPGLAVSELCCFSRFTTRTVEYATLRTFGRRSTAQLGAVGKAAGRDFAHQVAWLASHAAPSKPPPPSFDDTELQRTLLRYFVGRRDQIEGVVRWVHETPAGYGFLTGEAGSGKSALLARLRELATKDDAEATKAIDLGPVRFVWHFCQRRDERDDQVRILRSLCHQLQESCRDALGRVRPVPGTLSELRTRLTGLFDEISRATQTTEAPFKVVIVLDALDEATPYFGAADVLLQNFPDPLPPGLLVLGSYRVSCDGRPLLDLGDRGVRATHVLPTPLPPLDREAVHKLLHRLRTELAQDDALVDTIWQRSAGEPLYLYFLAQSVESGQLDLHNFTQVPLGLESFFRRRLWNHLPPDDDFLACRVLALLAAVRSPCTDAFAAAVLNTTEEAIADARRHFGSFLNFSSAKGGEYSLYHDRLKLFVQDLFAPEEQAALHDRLVRFHQEHLPETRPSGEERVEVQAALAYRHLGFHLFEKGRLTADFTELFAAHDAGFVEDKLLYLEAVNAVSEDYDLLLRACLLAGDLPRAFRVGLERSTIATEVQWLTTSGLPGLLTRLSPCLGERYLETLLGAIDLIEDETRRLGALVEIATHHPSPEESARLLRLAVTTMGGSASSVHGESWLAELLGCIGLRHPEMAGEAESLMRLKSKGAAGWIVDLGRWVALWTDPRLVKPLLEIVSGIGRLKSSESDRGRLDEQIRRLLELTDEPLPDLGILSQGAVPNTVTLLLESLLWAEPCLAQRPLLDEVSRCLRAHDVPSVSMCLLEARHLATTGNWPAVANAMHAAIGAFSMHPIASNLARIGMVLCELDRPGSPMVALEGDDNNQENLSFQTGLQLLEMADQRVARGRDVDMRGKRGTEIVMIGFQEQAAGVGGLAEIAAFTAAAYAAMGCEGPARANFTEAVERLQKEPLTCWLMDLPAIVRAALRFPEPRERVARLFDLLHAVETSSAGLASMSQVFPVALICELLPTIRASLPPELARPLLRRTAETARAFASDEARVRLLVACAHQLWETGAPEAAIDLTRESCLALAYRDRLEFGVKGFVPASEQVPNGTGRRLSWAGLAPDALADMLCSLAEADSRHANFQMLAETLADVLPSVRDPERREGLYQRLRAALRTAPLNSAPDALLDRLADAAVATHGGGGVQQALAPFIRHYESLTEEKKVDWIVSLFRTASHHRIDELEDRFFREATTFSRAEQRNRACTRIAEGLLQCRSNDPRLPKLLKSSLIAQEEFDAGKQEQFGLVAGILGRDEKDVQELYQSERDAERKTPAEEFQNPILQLSRQMRAMTQNAWEQRFLVAQVRSGRLAVQLGQKEMAVQLLQLAVDGAARMATQGANLGDLAGQLSKTAAACRTHYPDLGQELTKVVSELLLNCDTRSWMTQGCELALALASLSREDEALQLLGKRVRLAEAVPAAFPHDSFDKLIETMLGPWPPGVAAPARALAERAFAAIVRWRDEDICKAGPRAAGAVRFDVDRAMFLINRGDSTGLRLETHLALAEALADCQPTRAEYGAFRLISNAMRLPRDALLAVLTRLCSTLPGEAREDMSELAGVVFGSQGYDLMVPVTGA